jgi:Domain of Unknown Function (DUF1080)
VTVAQAALDSRWGHPGRALACAALALAGCASSTRFTTLLDAERGVDSLARVGAASWTTAGDAISCSEGAPPAFLVSPSSYGDFELVVEFWASHDANSGVFVRCTDGTRISDESCYEANIYDERPDPTYGTGAIVKLAAAPSPLPKAGGRWNTYNIRAEGPRLQLVLNGVQTVDVQDARLKRGPIALQWARGTIRFRRVRIRPL